jgi:hypothetical protein
VNGDDDVQSCLDEDYSVSEGFCHDDVRLLVKGTFVEFVHLDEESVPTLRRNKSEPALAYAAFSLIAPVQVAAPSPPEKSWADIPEGKSSDKQGRRSGRARQREQRRRRVRTPSPEMRNPWTGC